MRVAASRLAHTHLWQRLPKRLRRAGLERLASWLAPRPATRPVAGRSVVVAGVLRATTGLGQSARYCRQALVALGEAVETADVSDVFLAASSQLPAEVPNGAPSGGPGIAIIHVNAPLLPLACLRLGRAPLRGKVIVGYWAWELPGVPANWRRGADFVHEIWVPSQFVADAVRPIAGDRPVRVVPHPAALDFGTTPVPRPEEAGRPFTVLTMFDMSSGFSRKNPTGAIRAFRMAFGDDPSVRLIVKCHSAAVYPEGRRQLSEAAAGASNIVIDERTFDRAQVVALFRQGDAFLSLHRSEGFGLSIAEAMAAGMPAVVTNWSGNIDFCGDGNSMPVPARLIAASDPQGEYDHRDQLWADPDLDIAAAHLLRLRSDRNLRERLGRSARDDVLRHLGPEAYAQALAACRARFA